MIVKPGTGDAVGLAATRMAADPELAKSGQYIPKTDAVLFHTKMVPPLPAKLSASWLQPRATLYICTFPGHWTIMKGVMVVKQIYFTNCGRGGAGPAGVAGFVEMESVFDEEAYRVDRRRLGGCRTCARPRRAGRPWLPQRRGVC